MNLNEKLNINYPIMRKAFLFMIPLVVAIYSCKKTVQKNKMPGSFYLEDFRKPGMSDYETIKAACDSAPNFSKIIFAQKTYNIDHSVILTKKLDFYGPAILKREDQARYFLNEAATSGSTNIIVNKSDGLIPGDQILVILGQGGTEGTFPRTIKKINGDTLYLTSQLGVLESGAAYYKKGTTVLKNINFFWVIDSDKDHSTGSSFNDLTFDGNRNNNTGSYSWRINAAVMALTKSTTKYLNCQFFNSPSETIVGHNAYIKGCTFRNINGSAFHTSADRLTSAEDEIYSFVIDNTFENINQIQNSITGHSEGCITHSNSGGYYTATGNTFINIGDAVLGDLYPSVSVNDWGTSNITFTGNSINGAARIVHSVSMRPGTLRNVVIEKNTISNMPSLDWTRELAYFPEITLKDKNNE